MKDEREWIGVSDLMSVLMMVFLFIAILFMLQVQTAAQDTARQHKAMASIAAAHSDTRRELYDALQRAFGGELEKWDAEILPDGAVRFNRPEALFAAGSSEVEAGFARALESFFPRYAAVLASRQWREEIIEIRIEGHTSSDWLGGGGDAYLQNAKLSQARAFAVLEFAYKLPAVDELRPWLRRVLRATGVSFARPVLVDGVEDKNRSRRVEFRAITNADEKLFDILNSVDSF